MLSTKKAKITIICVECSLSPSTKTQVYARMVCIVFPIASFGNIGGACVVVCGCLAAYDYELFDRF